MLFIFSTPELTRNLWQDMTAVFQHWCLLCAVPFVANAFKFKVLVLQFKPHLSFLRQGILAEWEKALYSCPPRNNKFRSAAFNSEKYFSSSCKTSYLNNEVMFN
jgi:hypothetical protein